MALQDHSDKLPFLSSWVYYFIAPIIGVIGWLIRKLIYSVDEAQVRRIVDDKLNQMKEQNIALTDKYNSLADRLENIEDKIEKTYDRVDNIYEIIIKDSKQ